jgi:hypothetical protein
VVATYDVPLGSSMRRRHRSDGIRTKVPLKRACLGGGEWRGLERLKSTIQNWIAGSPRAITACCGRLEWFPPGAPSLTCSGYRSPWEAVAVSLEAPKLQFRSLFRRLCHATSLILCQWVIVSRWKVRIKMIFYGCSGVYEEFKLNLCERWISRCEILVAWRKSEI